MISQYHTSSPPAFECHHPYKDLSGCIPTVSEGLVRLQRRQRGKTTFRSRRKCLRHQIPQRICAPGKPQWNSLKVKRKYIFIRRLLHDQKQPLLIYMIYLTCILYLLLSFFRYNTYFHFTFQNYFYFNCFYLFLYFQNKIHISYYCDFYSGLIQKK